VLKRFQSFVAIRLIAANEFVCFDASHPNKFRKILRAHSTSPAMHYHLLSNHFRHVDDVDKSWAYHAECSLYCFQLPVLFVVCPNRLSLFVVEQWNIYGLSNVTLPIFARGSHIDKWH
jgi:hypothetical protein